MDINVRIEASPELEALLASLADSLNSLAVSAANGAAAAAKAPQGAEKPKKPKKAEAAGKEKEPAQEAAQSAQGPAQEPNPDYAAAHAACKALGVKLVQAQRREELKAVLADAGASKLSELTDEQAVKVAEALAGLAENDG